MEIQLYTLKDISKLGEYHIHLSVLWHFGDLGYFGDPETIKTKHNLQYIRTYDKNSLKNNFFGKLSDVFQTGNVYWVDATPVLQNCDRF